MDIAKRLEIYDVLKESLGEKESQMLLEYIDKKTESKAEIHTSNLVSRSDLLELKGDLKTEIVSGTTEIIKWMTILCVSISTLIMFLLL